MPYLSGAILKRSYDYLFKGYWRPVHRLYGEFHGVEVIQTPRNEPRTEEAMLAFGPVPTLEFDADFAESLVNLAYADFNADCTASGEVDQARAIQLAYLRPPGGTGDAFLDNVGRPLQLRGEEVARLLYTARQGFRAYVVTEVRTTLPPGLLHSETALMAELEVLGRALKIRSALGRDSETRRLDEDEAATFFSAELE